MSYTCHEHDKRLIFNRLKCIREEPSLTQKEKVDMKRKITEEKMQMAAKYVKKVISSVINCVSLYQSEYRNKAVI